MLSKVLDTISCAFPIFSHGERSMDELLEEYPFDEGGVIQLWEMFNGLSNEVMTFLRGRFPASGEGYLSMYCELQMSQLRDKITWIERRYECYRSMIASYS